MDVRALGQSLAVADFYLDDVLVGHVDVDGQVPERLGQGSARPLHGDDHRLDADVNALKDKKNHQVSYFGDFWTIKILY